MIIEASRQATIKSEARSSKAEGRKKVEIRRPKAESCSVSGFGMVLSQRPSPPTQGSSARSAMFIATTTPDAQPSSVGVVVATNMPPLDEPGGAFGYKHVAPTGLDPSRAPKLFLNKTQKDYYEN